MTAPQQPGRVELDPRAVALGAGVAMAVGIPTSLLGQVVLDDDSNLVFAFFVVQLLGFLAGGFVAASKRPDAPMAHGGVAALAGYVVVQVLGTIARLVRGDEIRPVTYVFNALLASSIGIVGGIVADRRAGRSAPGP